MFPELFTRSSQLFLATFYAAAEWLDGIYGYFFRQPIEIIELHIEPIPDLTIHLRQPGPLLLPELIISELAATNENVRVGFLVESVEYQRPYRLDLQPEHFENNLLKDYFQKVNSEQLARTDSIKNTQPSAAEDTQPPALGQ